MTGDPTPPTADAEVAELALRFYAFSDQRTVRMINLSENATYLVEDPDTGRSGILRVHRIDYHPRESIESELDWLSALREDAGVATPRVIRTQEGERIVTIRVRGVDRHAVLFEVVPGIEPDALQLDRADFQTLGALTARMHRHARSWQRPASFTRFSWDWQHTLGDTPRWGRWSDGIGVGEEEEEVLGRAASLVRQRLAAYGYAADRYGLVHADLRAANLLVHKGEVTVIDFDDCGFSWFMYDFGTAVSFVEDDPRLADWQSAWLRGYRSVEPLAEEHEQMLATFVILRRMLLLAWMGSHSHSRECQEIGPSYTAGSVELARRYLTTNGDSLF